jgi:molecular chaperone HscB
MQVMELREQLEEAQSEEDVEAIKSENSEYLQQTLRKIDALLDDANGQDDVDWEKMKKLTVELRYWSNIEDVCREWQPGQAITLHH